jgi:hypothetical protein
MPEQPAAAAYWQEVRNRLEQAGAVRMPARPVVAPRSRPEQPAAVQDYSAVHMQEQPVAVQDYSAVHMQEQPVAVQGCWVVHMPERPAVVPDC